MAQSPKKTKSSTKAKPTTAARSEKQDDELVKRAVAALANAYSPYSKIRVGAALLAKDGRIFTGCNVENASYGLTLCAERAAVVAAVAGGARQFTAIVVATNLEHVLMPCGACRQVLSEFAPKLRVVVVGADGSRREMSLGDLLPDAFRSIDLL
jgi:cytidine deaminase